MFYVQISGTVIDQELANCIEVFPQVGPFTPIKTHCMCLSMTHSLAANKPILAVILYSP